MPSFQTTFLVAALATIPFVAAAEKPCVKFGGFMNGAIVYGNQEPMAIGYEMSNWDFNVTSSSTGETLCSTVGAQPSETGNETTYDCTDGAKLMWHMVESNKDVTIRATLRYQPKDTPERAVLSLVEESNLKCDTYGGCRGDISGVKCFECGITATENVDCEGI